MINLCDQFKNFSKAALLFDREGMQKIASVGIPAYDLAGQRQETIDFSLSLVDTMDGEIAKQNGYVDQAEELFNNKEDVIFEDALSIFEDIVYFLQQGKKEFLSTAYTSYRQLPGSDAAGNLLAVKLLEADSSLTITDLGLRSTSLTVRTDSTGAGQYRRQCGDTECEGLETSYCQWDQFGLGKDGDPRTPGCGR